MDVLFKEILSEPQSSSDRRLFWIQTGTNGTLLFVAAAFIYFQYFRSGIWQYLGLAVIALYILSAHIFGWVFAYKKNNYRLAIWVIGISHIVGSIAAPLFMENYWIIGPFLLLLVPLEIGLVDNLKRVPVAFVCALLGAAGMLLVDLWAPFDRVRFLSEVYGALELVSILLLLQFIVHVWVLWNFRLALDPQHGFRIDLATQLALVFTGMAGVSIFLVVGVLLIQMRSTQTLQVGQNFQSLAQINAERVGNTLNNQIDNLLALGRQNSILQQGLEAANEAYKGSDQDAIKSLLEIDQTWVMLPDVNEFVLRFRSNAQSIELSKFRGIDLLHNNLLLVDRMGGLVASQGDRPIHFYFGDQEWFLKAWNEGLGGIFIGDFKFDPDTRSGTVRIAVGVLDPKTNRTSGVLSSFYSIQGLQQEILISQYGQTEDAALVTKEGLVIAATEADLLGMVVWEDLTESLRITAENGGGELSGTQWMLGTDHQGENVILATSPLKTTSNVRLNELRALEWLTVISEPKDQALALVTRSIKVTTLVGILLMIVMMAVAIYLARLLAKPLETLRAAAVAASRGDLNQQAELNGPMELVSLAEAFNALTAHLRLLINNLQDEVAERTSQLQTRADQLATLNRITGAVVSARDLESALNVVAREMVYLFAVKHTAIALLDKDGIWLTVVAEFDRFSEQPNTLNMKFKVEQSSISKKVITEGCTLTFSQAQLELAGEPIHILLTTTGTHSMMIVPLQARGQVIGTIDVTCSDDNREFTPSEIELAETIAGQIAGAIDNARLFTEMERAKENAESANAAKSDFLANVSHELRTPLTSVLGFARIVEKRLQERIFPNFDPVDTRTRRAIEQVNDNLKIIVAEGERLTQLINDVLDLSKIEAGKVEWNYRPLNIADVIEHSAQMATSLLLTKPDIQLVLEIPGDLPEIRGDRNRLIQVMTNLFSNAIKFTERGRITARAEVKNHEIIISVADTGTGITRTDQDKVFEKFIQLGDTLTEKPSGTGLGLPITKEIIEAHGGQIWLESEFGKGSTFYFTLPLSYEGSLQKT